MVPTPLAFAYYSDVVEPDDGGAPVIWDISMSEHDVVSILYLITTAREGAVGVGCLDSLMGGNIQVCLSPWHLLFAANWMISAFLRLPLVLVLIRSPT